MNMSKTSNNKLSQNVYNHTESCTYGHSMPISFSQNNGYVCDDKVTKLQELLVPICRK